MYHLCYSDVKSFIPTVPADALPWQYPVLQVEVYENGEYYQTTLDGRLIKADRCLKRTPLEKFVAHYPEIRIWKMESTGFRCGIARG